MKICPECHTENPHKAKRCMNCGAMLVDENDLSVEEQLRQKLMEAEKRIRMLETALDNQMNLYEEAQKRIAQLEQNGNANTKTAMTGKSENVNDNSDKFKKKAHVDSVHCSDSGLTLQESEAKVSVEDDNEVSRKGKTFFDFSTRIKEKVKKIVGKNEDDSHIICYEASEKVQTDWIDKNSVSHKFAKNIGKIMLKDAITEIGGYAFYYSGKLKSVAIPDYVTSIGGFAFFGCTALESIKIGKSVKIIGGYAFRGCCSLTAVDIPVSVINIGYAAFASCSGLESVTIPNSVESIGGLVFFACNSLTTVVLPTSVTSIGASAFKDCSELKSIVIPDTVTSIGDKAFMGCGKLPEAIKKRILKINKNAL